MNAKPTAKRSRRNRTHEILQIATELFSEYGFQGTTLAMVAEAVGLTEPGVLHYFPSKVHLLQGVLDYQDQKDFEKHASFLDIDKIKISELFGMMANIWASKEQNPVLVQLFTVLVGESISTEHPSHAFFVGRYNKRRDIYVQQLLKTQIRQDVDAEIVADLMMAFVDGIQIQWLLEPEKVNLKATFDLFSKILINYLEVSS